MASMIASTTSTLTYSNSFFTSAANQRSHHYNSVKFHHPRVWGPWGRGISPFKSKFQSNGWAHKSALHIHASSSSSASAMPLSVKPDDLVESILSKVMQTDRGVLLTREEHGKVAELTRELQQFCVAEPVKCPLIFGEWDVVYCSNPTSPGGGYRSAFGRMFFKTNEMIQLVEAPDTVRNKVSFSLLGFLDGEVSLKGKLNALDEKWIKVVFEPPELKVRGLQFQYGGESEVKLEITYIDEKIRLGKGSRGSVFVFQRRNMIS